MVSMHSSSSHNRYHTARKFWGPKPSRISQTDDNSWNYYSHNSWVQPEVSIKQVQFCLLITKFKSTKKEKLLIHKIFSSYGSQLCAYYCAYNNWPYCVPTNCTKCPIFLDMLLHWQKRWDKMEKTCRAHWQSKFSSSPFNMTSQC